MCEVYVCVCKGVLRKSSQKSLRQTYIKCIQDLILVHVLLKNNKIKILITYILKKNYDLR